jgi:negative elongation factor B
MDVGDEADGEGDGHQVDKFKQRVRVGGEGGDFVAQTLSTTDNVGEAIKRVQQQGALATADSADTEPLLGLLGQLGLSHAESYRCILDDALTELRGRVGTMPQGTLLSLLDASFPYIGIEELKAVPLAVLEHLTPVPSSYLKQISRDTELFRQLPLEVQRQCWALKAVLLRRHTQPSLLAYSEETATVMRNLNCDLVLAPLNREEDWAVYPPGHAPAEPAGGPRAVPGLPRKSLRRVSASIIRLKRVVGSSKVLYLGVVAHCRLHYAQTAATAVCSLRSQLLMALHDDEQTELYETDQCHKLAWLADACIRDRCLDGRRLADILAIVDKMDFDSQAGQRAKGAAAKAAAKTTAAKPAVKASGGSGGGGGKKGGGKVGTRGHAAAVAAEPKPAQPALKFTFGKKAPVAAATGGAASPAAATRAPAAPAVVSAGPPESVEGGNNTDGNGEGVGGVGGGPGGGKP